MWKRPITSTLTYDRNFRQLTLENQLLVIETVEFLYQTQEVLNFRPHFLREESKIWSISILPDLRILYKKRPDDTILLVNVGNHDMEYKNI